MSSQITFMRKSYHDVFEFLLLSCNIAMFFFNKYEVITKSNVSAKSNEVYSPVIYTCMVSK